MMYLLGNISVVLFASVYLLASLVTMIHQVTVPCVSSGSEKVQTATGSSKERPLPVLTQRRYVPLVKEGAVSPFIPATGYAGNEVRQYASVQSNNPMFPASAFYFSFLSNRAPPLS